jgi:glutamate dehydrogenase
VSLAEETGALRAFADAYLRRLADDGAGIPQADLEAEVRSAFEFASARGRAPIGVRALNPTREEHGYEPLGSVVETNTEDWPFLVDSVTAELRGRGLEIVRVLHPIIGTERDEQGRLLAVTSARGAPHRESVMHFDLGRRLDDDELAELEAALRAVLEAVRAAVRDFEAMRVRAATIAEQARDTAGARYAEDEVDEVVAFLDWLRDGAFVFLGAREYEFGDGQVGVVKGSGLGILADEQLSGYSAPVPLERLPEAIRERALGGDLLLVSKTNARSPVHRRERMDYVGVRRVSPDGEIVGESRLLGLFTTKAYAQPSSETPLLHRKLAQALEGEDLIEGSHDFKAAVALFDSFPKDELFAAPGDDLRRAVVALAGLGSDTRARLLGRREPDGRSASLILALAPGRYDEALVERVQALFRQRFDTASVAAHRVLDEDRRVRVHFTVHRPDGLPDVSIRELEAAVSELARTWDDELEELLVGRHGAARGRALAQGWAQRFPEHYKGYTSPAMAAQDVLALDRMGDTFVVGLQPLPAGGPTRVALYKRGGKIELSQVMPLLEDLGLRVIEEISTQLLGEDETWVQEFRVLGPGQRPLDVEAVGERVAEAIAALYRGEAESDSLNRLVIDAGLTGAQVGILRAYRRYRQRVGSRFTEGYQNDVLAANPEITAKLLRYFELRFDPALDRDAEAEGALREEILADLEAVPSLDHDRILRNQLGVIDATLRTSAYKSHPPVAGAIAFKLRSPDVPAIPMPAPEFEIYVYGSEVEGIHLRGGVIARGGIRYSDRMDYRTEVYGLMRAQVTKNAVIVPAGAKGGFIVKAGDRDIERHYVTYIRALLDVTDNLVDGEVVHPEGVRVLDEEDTYLVVAADKGTATFSDTANRVAREYGFWLDDAFASGGSSGYDHKALGITARGAWESVKRHFRELDMDPETDVFSAVGIGDMSGDVFGNGMLLSDKIRLLAAYDHRHVFIDPDPDPAASFAERRRLFEAPRSSWDDYDREVISEGGGVWSRSAKSIALSPQAREALGTEAERLPPNEVIRAILRAQVDLLWNGGIGTVVKASWQSDAAAHDRSSDAIRVDASDLRCRVVAEGGNLGFTRLGRVEYAQRGGRINSDFIDNSAGVDCSDHEVNLKILLGLAERRGELDRSARDELLRDVTEDVVAHVLYDSFLAAQILGQEVERSASRMFAYEDLMGLLEETGRLERAAEDLPSPDEITERRRSGRGMERPELAILLAYAKSWIARSLERSELVEDPWLERDLRSYFPAAVVERFGELLPEHPLKRQLICMTNANLVVNALGPTLVSQIVAERGAEPAVVVRAFRIAREVTGAHALWDEIERLEGAGRTAQAELMGGIDALVEATARWYVAWEPEGAIAEAVSAGREGFERLAAIVHELGTDERRARRDEIVGRLREQGVPEHLARAHAERPELVHAPDMVVVARATGRSVEDVARVFFAIGAELRLDWMERELERVRSATRMQRWALQAAREDAFEARRELAECVLNESPGAPPEEAVARFLEEHSAQARRLEGFLRALAREGDPDLAGLTLAVRQLRAIVG